ncbi:NAD(P)/FAD-dependent oxidoreductase [Agromyces cerinus]|uniref:Thioredoxin reductase n=1 Tax=Agromyces cerinus subsp. cerinus TaxID=232089 RepID=A0A1N6I3L2_9MICO|nr:NAD(P)/FAD-dependent oxidoreductase [Agromyces cerinus]SIO26617.1 Thioredoxin reductase [Agromyces cerinus subsp. cerinus]
MQPEPLDVIIVGGGSAGLSAALMLVRARRRVLVLDTGAPRNGVAAHMHGVLGRDGWSPLELLERGRDEVARYGGVVRGAEVASAEATDGDASGGPRFAVSLASGERHVARRLLVATGLRDELPELPGLAEQWGTGAVVCPFCDGWEVRDRRIGVLATGPRSLHQVQMLRQWSPSVTFFTNGAELDGDASAGMLARGIAVEPRVWASVAADEAGRLSGIRLVDNAVIALDAIFLGPRPVPNDALLTGLGATTAPAFGDADWVGVDPTGRTSVPGVWAAGNVVNPGASVPIAAGAGSLAGMTINSDLIEEEIRAALAG